MTLQAKEKLIQYLTGKLEITKGDNIPTFGYEKGNDNTKLYSEITSLSFSSVIDVLQAKNNKNENLDKLIFYGNYTYNENPSGFIIITDTKFNHLQTITEYDSGTKFGEFQRLNVAEDGSLYGIDFRYGDAEPRFIMLNNVALKSPKELLYKAVLRKSYLLPSEYKNTINRYHSVEKGIGLSTYLIVGDSGDSVYYIRLDVKVGEENNWSKHQYDVPSNSNVSSVLGTKAIFHEEETEESFGISFSSLISVYNRTSNTNEIVIHKLYYYYSRVYTKTLSILEGNEIDVQSSCVFINTILCYFSVLVRKGTTNNYEIRVYKVYSLTESSSDWRAVAISSQKFTFNIVEATLIIGGFLYVVEGNVFIKKTYESDTELGIRNDIFRIIDDKEYGGLWFYSDPGKFPSISSAPLNVFTVSKQYNLYICNSEIFDFYNSIIQVYNEFNYNGLEYSDTNCLVPSNVVMTDNDNTPIFARNIFNKTVNGSTTVASVEVPNTLLNDVTTKSMQLYSETNLLIEDSPEFLNKNIYETIDVNFFNTLHMINKNDEVNPIENINGAVSLNYAISTDDKGTNYSKFKMSKCKINYSDNTSRTLNISPSQVEVVDLLGIIDIQVYCPTNKNITNIQLLSEDENTIYQEITNLNLENGKYYNITQNVEIVNEPIV